MNAENNTPETAKSKTPWYAAVGGMLATGLEVGGGFLLEACGFITLAVAMAVHGALLLVANVVCSAFALVACGSLVVGKLGMDCWHAFPSTYGYLVPRTFHRLFNERLKSTGWISPSQQPAVAKSEGRRDTSLHTVIRLCDDYRARVAEAVAACRESHQSLTSSNAVVTGVTARNARYERRLERVKTFLNGIVDDANLPNYLASHANELLLSFGLREYIWSNNSVTVDCDTDIEGNLLRPLTMQNVSDFLRAKSMPIPAEQIRIPGVVMIRELGLYSLQVTCEPGDEPVDLKLWVVPTTPQASTAVTPRDASTVDDVPSET